MADFTPTQGRYLAFISAYIRLHGYPPAESEIAAAMCVSPPSVNQMVKNLEKRGLISRRPGQARTIEVLVPEEKIPEWNKRAKSSTPATRRPPPPLWMWVRNDPPPEKRNTPAKLYVLSVYLLGGPVSDKFANKETSRTIEIRGDQTLEELHHAIFNAFDRTEQHAYEFQFGKRPHDPDGPNFGSGAPVGEGKANGDARTTTLDDLKLERHKIFGYWFDFGDDWFHQIDVDRIEKAIPTVTYPRVIKRVGKSPPQYMEE